MYFMNLIVIFHLIFFYEFYLTMLVKRKNLKS